MNYTIVGFILGIFTSFFGVFALTSNANSGICGIFTGVFFTLAFIMAIDESSDN